MASVVRCRHAGPSPVALRAALPPRRLRAAAPRRRRVRAALAAAPAPAPGGIRPRLPERSEAASLERLLCREEVEEERERVSAETIDGWMKESISEIVRSLGEAPFLVQLFRRGGGGGDGLTLQREAAAPGRWPEMKKRWGRGGEARPDGVILVEELVGAGEDGEGNAAAGAAAVEKARRMWGLVVQGRGMECVACYVLDTCRVRSPAGFCTHFCLARAQCFGDPVELQLRDAWLQRLS